MSQFVMNTWYPLTWSRNVKQQLSSHKIVGKKVVTYRTTAGKVVALEDVCPHRMLPLSMGKLKGDDVECGYHGLTFDCSGKCVRIPGQDIIPNTAKVHAYPTHENMGLVWIWMGDPSKADIQKIFDLPQYHDPKWNTAEGDALHINANYLSLADNLCDPSHVSFVHLSTLGTAQGEDIPVHSEEFPDKVLTWRWIIDQKPIPLFKKYGNFSDSVDRWHYYHYYAPSIAIIDFGTAETGTGAPDGNRDNCMQIYACHFITPVDETTCIDHWMHIKNFPANDELNARLTADFRVAFSEDKAILEAIQENENALPNHRPLRLAIDASPQRMRRMVDRLLAAEGHAA